jgi:hypothetical protein
VTPEYLPEQSICPLCAVPGPGAPAVEPFIQYCCWHQPEKDSPDDWKTGIRTMGLGGGDADGADCRAFAEVLRRK